MFGKNDLLYFLCSLILFKVTGGRFTDRFHQSISPQEAPYAVKIKHGVTRQFQANGVLFTPVLVLSIVFDFIKSEGILSKAKHLQVTAIELSGNDKLPRSIVKKQTRGVKKVIIHPEFEINQAYDISIVWVAEPFVFSEKIHAIDVSVKEPFPGQKCFFASWAPKYTKQEVWPRPYESHSLKSSWVFVNNSFNNCEDQAPDIHICASDLNVLGCTNDYGGGLICDNALVGILIKRHVPCVELDRKGALFINVIEAKYFLLNVKRAAKLSTQTAAAGQKSLMLVLRVILTVVIEAEK